MKHCLLLTSKYSVLIANVERHKNECLLTVMQESYNFPFVYDEAEDGGSVVAINYLFVCVLLLLYCIIVIGIVAFVRVCVFVCVCTKVQGPCCQNQQTDFTTARSVFRSESRDEAEKKLKCKKYICKRD